MYNKSIFYDLLPPDNAMPMCTDEGEMGRLSKWEKSISRHWVDRVL